MKMLRLPLVKNAHTQNAEIIHRLEQTFKADYPAQFLNQSKVGAT